MAARVRAGVAQVRLSLWPAVQTAAAAAIAWSIAHYLLGHEQPFFAAVAAVIAMGSSRGQRGRRALEMVAGVTLGVAVADLLLLAIDPVPLRIALGALVAMSVAILIGGGGTLVNQAAVWSILVATVPLPPGALVPERFFDALVGGATALLFSQLLFPLHPLVELTRAARPVVEGLAEAVDELAAAVAARDQDAALDALNQARALDAPIGTLNEMVDAARAAARMAPPRRGYLRQLDPYTTMATRLEYATRNVRVLGRGVRRLLRQGEIEPATASALAAAMRDLAEAVRAIGRQLDAPGRVGSGPARAAAVRAVRTAEGTVAERGQLALSLVVGQVHSTASDLLQASGMDMVDALQALEETS
jgi:uncharacterized membrane protein YgaE (UPF0421/DUF939 family)